jgi:predicted acylesterase/phospholipase RssA
MAKKALITSGGGAKGAFTIGALLAMKKKGLLPFDLISGTSTGSFIAALAAADDLETLRYQYLHVKPNDILSKQNIIHNVLNRKAFIYDTYPLRKLIADHITTQVYNKIMSPASPILCITAVSLQTGLATVFTNSDLPPPPVSGPKYKIQKFVDRQMMLDALLASGSQAGFTPPVDIGTEQFVDGGHRDVIPTRIVIDLGMEDVYVLSNNPSTQFVDDRRFDDDLLGVVLRLIGIFVQDVRENDMKILRDYLSLSSKSPILIEPPSDLDEENPTGLRFDPMLMAAWMTLGEETANKILSPGNPINV